MKYQYRLLEEELMYQGFMRIRRFKVQYELYRGGFSPVLLRECSGRGGTVASLVHDPEKRLFLFVEQFRIGAMVANVNPWQIELVAGIMDKSAESPEQAILREIKEEIGTEALRLTHLTSYFSSLGGSGTRTHLFLAEVNADDAQEFSGVEEEGEDIRIVKLSYEETFALLAQGGLDNSQTLSALQNVLLQQFSGNKLLNLDISKLENFVKKANSIEI